MIQLTCAQCKAALEVDDAFAGGVCRCQYCGTIQTVPRPGARPRSPGATAGAAQHQAHGDEPKALYQVKSRTGLSSAPSGLEELAEVVHSSGLSGSGLLNRSHARLSANFPKQKKPAAKQNKMLWMAIGGGAGLLVVVLLLIVIMSGGTKPATSGDGSADGGSPLVASGGVASFGGIDLSDGDKVIFVIDRGDATASHFNAIKRMTTAAVRGIGPQRRFQVILWDNGQTDAYPKLSTEYAREDEVDRLSKWFDDVPTGQSTDAIPAVKQAMLQSPDVVVLVTGKADQLPGTAPSFAEDVLKLRAGKKTVFHTVTLGDTDPADPLKKIALETGGQHKIIDRGELSRLMAE